MTPPHTLPVVVSTETSALARKRPREREQEQDEEEVSIDDVLPSHTAGKERNPKQCRRTISSLQQEQQQPVATSVKQPPQTIVITPSPSSLSMTSLHRQGDVVTFGTPCTPFTAPLPPPPPPPPQQQPPQSSPPGASVWNQTGTAAALSQQSKSQSKSHWKTLLLQDMLLLLGLMVWTLVMVQGWQVWRQSQSPLFVPTLSVAAGSGSGSGSGSAWEINRTTTTTTTTNPADADAQDCIYVTGGGFSGFWFTLGRLHSLSLEERRQQTFTCYSAGCLGVVAAVYTNHSMLELYDMARSIQMEWKQGTLHRYHVVPTFVDRLLQQQEQQLQQNTTISSSDASSSLHILTSVPVPPWGLGGFQAHMQRPTSTANLRQLLIQTTWIPMAIGSELTYQGHLDGAFSFGQHPHCRHKVGLASAWHDWRIMANTLNVNLNQDQVQYFYDLGLDYGI